MAAKQRPVVLEEVSNRSLFGKLLAMVLALFSGVWLLNFSVGIFEIPDFLPVVGNIDEAAAAWLFFSSLSYLGFNVVPNAAKATKFKTRQDENSR